MMSPRWRKVLSDLWNNKIRTLLVVASIAVGVFALGVIAGSYLIILKDLQAQYQAVNPHSATISSEPFDETLVDRVRHVPGVGEAQGRITFFGRLQAPSGAWYQTQIYAIPPLDEMRLDRLSPEDVPAGTELGKNEIFIERAALIDLAVKPGDTVWIELPEGKVRALRVAGIVHDLVELPYAFVGQVYGYVTPDTMEWLGLSREYNQMVIAVAEKPKDEEHVRAVTRAVEEQMEKSGHRVSETMVFKPGEHPAMFIIEALLALLGGMGLLTLLLSGFLVVNTISALLGQHLQQIGVMKAIGASTGQVMSMYIVLVLSFGLLALLLAVPLSIPAAFAMARSAAYFLNFSIPTPYIQPPVIILQVVVALMLPLLAAVVPVFNGTRITTREAISDYGLGQGQHGQGWIDRLLRKIQGFSRPLLLSLRNTFRRKARLMLTLSTLTLGGAIFIAVFNVRASFTATMEEVMGLFLADVNIYLDRPRRIEEVAPLLMDIPGVARVEGWASASGKLLSDDEEITTDLLIAAPPADSTLIEPILLEGRWLLPEDDNAVVVTNILLSLRPEIKVGDEIVTEIHGKQHSWRVVGTVKVGGNFTAAPLYASYDDISTILHQFGEASQFRIGIENQDAATQALIGEMAETCLERTGIKVGTVLLGHEVRQQNEQSFAPVIVFLLAMAVLIAVVGGLGLTGTMSMNVMERTREIGVMRAIGASNRAIVQMVVVEGTLIGVISWALGILLAVPISKVLGAAVGMGFVSIPLTTAYALEGFILWLVVVMTLSALASALPARNAAQITIRDALAYE